MRADSIVHRLLAPCRGSVHLSRWRSLAFAATSVLLADRLGICPMGRAARASTRPKHAIKRIDRLVGNPRLERDRFAICAGLARRLVTSRHPIVLIDWTHLDECFSALAASLPVAGRSIPIHTDVHPRALYSNRRVQHRFLEQLAEILPEGTRPILVADAGFQTPWWTRVDEMGWDFVVRLGGGVGFEYLGIGKVRVADVYHLAGPRPADFGWTQISRQRPAVARVIQGKRFVRNRRRKPQPRRRTDKGDAFYRARKRSQEPWMLATSLEAQTPKEICAIYAERMKIEESFRDLKSSRFGWSLTQTRAKSTLRWNNLLLIALVAMVAMLELGRRCEEAGRSLEYQANSIRHRRVLSLFSLGKAVLARARNQANRAPPDLSRWLSPQTSSVICGDP